MVKTNNFRPLWALVAIGLAACQSGGAGEGTSDAATTGQPRPQITQNELEAFCPPVTIRHGTASYNAFAKGGQGDPTKVTYQASISDATRACTRAGGMMTITVAIAGRVVPGPAGAPSSVTMPIRIAVTRGDEVLYSQMIKDPVALDASNAATQFLVKDSNVVIPIPERPTVRVQVGFDEAVAVKAGASNDG